MVTGFPATPPALTVAVSELAPSCTVQLPALATPFTPLVAFPPVTAPPPLATVLFVAAVCPSPDSLTTDAGGPAIAVAVNVTGVTLAPTIEAWTCCGAPAVGPSVHSIVVRPAASVAPLGLDRLPPPSVTANV